jgi:hypothetical protein
MGLVSWSNPKDFPSFFFLGLGIMKGVDCTLSQKMASRPAAGFKTCYD